MTKMQVALRQTNLPLAMILCWRLESVYLLSTTPAPLIDGWSIHDPLRGSKFYENIQASSFSLVGSARGIRGNYLSGLHAGGCPLVHRALLFANGHPV